MINITIWDIFFNCNALSTWFLELIHEGYDVDEKYKNNIKFYITNPFTAIRYCQVIEDDTYMHDIIVESHLAPKLYYRNVRKDNNKINQVIKERDGHNDDDLPSFI